MPFRSLSTSSFLGASLGTMIEYYDYGLFLVFLPLLSPVFFPAETASQSLMKGYVILLLALLARPLGGIAFGYWGDMFGRKKALLASIYGIAFATFAIGIIPSYATIGIAATLLVTLAKTLQVFCFGGEYNGAGIYVVEHAQGQREALAGSMLTAMTLMGYLFAAAVGTVLTLPHIPAGSWRIAFMLGGVIGIIAIIYRKKLHESPGFTQADPLSENFSHLIKNYPRELLAGVFIGGLVTVPVTSIIAFIGPMLVSQGKITLHYFMFMQVVLTLIGILALVFFGAVADKKSPHRVMTGACWILLVGSYPLLMLTDRGNNALTFSAMIVFVILNEMFGGPSNAYLKNLFPPHYRYRGSSLSFCTGLSVFGGLTPIVDHFLYQYSNHFSTTFLWWAFVSGGALFSLSRIQNRITVGLRFKMLS